MRSRPCARTRRRGCATHSSPSDNAPTSPWSNGVLLARYSFWISVPWVLAVYLRQELSSALQNREFLIAALLLPLISNVLQWPVIGFVFGYLYPYIRGANGLWKGLSVAGAVIAP